MSLSERIRPGSEAAPWVVEEIKNIESRVKELEAELAKEKEWSQNHVDDACGVQEENARLVAENSSLRKVVEAARTQKGKQSMALKMALRELDGVSNSNTNGSKNDVSK